MLLNKLITPKHVYINNNLLNSTKFDEFIEFDMNSINSYSFDEFTKDSIWNHQIHIEFDGLNSN